MFEYSLKNGVIVTSGRVPKTGVLGVSGERIFHPDTTRAADLEGRSFVYPALINTHDHLQGNYLPRVGPKPGTFYLTWLPWDNDLKASEVFIERSRLSREELYALSAYKNLFSGVATVNDHFPQAMNKTILPKLPIRAILNYGLAHEVSSYDLKWGDGVEVEHRRAVKNGWSFITHLAEGFDGESMDGVKTLERLGVLDNHCLLVHGIGFSDEDIRKVAKAGASVSWCAASNMFMFNVTCKIKKLLNAGVNVTIGTDSAATGSYNFLEELHYDRDLYRRLYGEDLPAQKIFEMVTVNAAKAFWMQDQIGALEEGKTADILVLKGRTDDPYENLISASMEDIELLTLAGKPLYGELRFIDLFGGKLPKGYSRITVADRPMFVIGNPGGLYREVRKKIGFKKILDFLPFEPEA
ncbi:MAG: amidohydrolase family protein [Spirochaetaceae bacterium]|jgi:cytosine/adenosine deaminase-related metal-dependent hydrolase|nr:amidohydrolase family protein [Spirochaetaceae bacterium]